MFPTGFVGHLRESTEQFLKDLSHRVVIYLIGMQIDFGELIAEAEQSVTFVEPFNKPIEIEVFDDVAHVLTESVEVVLEVEMDIVRVGFQSREVVPGGIVEAGVCLSQNNRWYQVFRYFAVVLIIGTDRFLFSSVLV